MDRPLRAARAATFGFFAINGFVLGMWIVHIPLAEQRVGISHAVLGWLLLLLGGGAFAGMQVAGPLTDRVGAHRVVPVSAALCAAAVVLPGLATAPWALGAALVVLGFGNGCLDVSMNAHAVQVEHGYGRPVMSAFHAVFSVGGVIASLLGALTLNLGWSAAQTLGAVALAGLAGTGLATPLLLRPQRPAPASGAADPGTLDAAGEAAGAAAGGTGAPAGGRRRTPRRIWVLAGLALMLMLCEGVANDWSALDLRDVLGAPAATAALAYGSFATAMTLGRFVTDRIAARFGAVAVLRYGSALAAVGLAGAAGTHVVPLALACWSLFGLGLSGCIPQLFSAAGHADQAAAGANVSRVAGLGYLGMLAGPAVIGPLTRFVPLNVALFLPVALCAAASVAAGAAGSSAGSEAVRECGVPAATGARADA
ncbi:MFS transporter [Streptomyces sp. V4-01]|uniref:MFS transporter n=1 Tax=Actinacidiphila polyblastidii TaxID=3110430 RepID=A0ABU7P3S2_9ACTN|nr:MFS transporter [Streptomyces sp. V4-01]